MSTHPTPPDTQATPRTLAKAGCISVPLPYLDSLKRAEAESAQLRAEVERWKKDQENTQWLWGAAVKQSDQFRARVAELEQDKARLEAWKLWAAAYCPETLSNASDAEKRAYMEKAHASQTQTIHQFIGMVHQLRDRVAELEQENTRLTQLLRNRLVEVQEQQQGGITT